MSQILIGFRISMNTKHLRGSGPSFPKYACDKVFFKWEYFFLPSVSTSLFPLFSPFLFLPGPLFYLGPPEKGKHRAPLLLGTTKDKFFFFSTFMSKLDLFN